MARLCQQFSMLVLPHFLATFFDNTTQLITSYLNPILTDFMNVTLSYNSSVLDMSILFHILSHFFKL
jgi:hypothetical protein